jgi:hypothetical protein
MVENIEKYVNLAKLRGRFYITFKSIPIQRWAAKQVGEGKDYVSLTTTLWRKAGLPSAPQGCQDGIMNANTVYYFEQADDAYKAAVEFLRVMREEGVLK